MEAKLKSIAEVILGYQQRPSKTVTIKEPTRFNIVNIKDIPAPSVTVPIPQFATKTLDSITLPARASKYLIRRDDILFQYRGKISATLVARGAENTIASNLLYIIRITSQNILPEYLTWYLNLPRTQKILLKHHMGSNIKMLSKNALLQLEVVAPSVQNQKAVVEMTKLSQREQSLTERLTEAKAKLVKSIGIKTVFGGLE